MAKDGTSTFMSTRCLQWPLSFFCVQLIVFGVQLVVYIVEVTVCVLYHVLATQIKQKFYCRGF